MDLIIVESPTKAKTLSRFLGPDYRIDASMGHIRDLPESKLGIDVENDFAPQYVVPAKKKDKVKELQAEAKKADTVILATDPDREGEAIAWHIAQILSENSNSKKQIAKSNLNFKRITFHEITESAIKEALSHPGTINMPLVDAQQARRILDRLVGYKLSPLLWRKIRRGLSAGRVQSVAVRLIVEREREIEKFKAVEYWQIKTKLDRRNETGDSKERTFEAKLIKSEDKNVEIGNKEEADKIVAELEKGEYQVSNVIAKEVRRNPSAPFTTSTLQQTASNLFGWSAKRTMQVAQNLYEQGLISYHRTDSTNLAVEAISEVRKYITDRFGKEYLPADVREYKTKSKVAQEAHEAIRPTKVERSPKNIKDAVSGSQFSLDHEQLKLYELIWNRFVACQMASAVVEQTSVDVSCGKYLLRGNGNRMIFDGWQKLFEKVDRRKEIDESKQDNEEDDNDNQQLPKLDVGDNLDLVKVDPSQHFTQPPPRFNEASLIKILEEYGIGRPSTYAPIISTISERQYVEKLDRKLHPTALGFAVNDFLMTHFPTIFDYQFTAKMENDLDEVANGQRQWVPLIKEFFDPMNAQINAVSDSAERVKVEVEATDEVCPVCGSPMVVRVGKFGKFLACSRFPDCKTTKPFSRKIDVKCPKCGIGEVVLKRTKSKKSFYGCNRYPECDFASWSKPKSTNEIETKEETSTTSV